MISTIKGQFLQTLIVALLLAGSSSAESYQKDKEGLLVPRMSYPRFLERTYHFVLHDLDNGWATGNAYKDQDGKAIPAYVNYALVNSERKLGIGDPRNADVVYPAFHHALFIRAFLAQWRYTGDPECLARARQLADWNLARRTPPDCKFGSLFYSTAHMGKVGGSVDGDAIMTDKPAIMALAILELSGATGDARYREAAEAVATTLAKTQLPEGNWPFRVNPKTGEVREAYTSSAIYALMLFEALGQGNDNRWAEAKAKTLKWILEGPVKTLQWNGFYEDVTKDMGKNNRTNWDCIDTARWLIAHRADNPEYLPMAMRLHDWIAKEFVEKNNAWAPAEGLREQKCCFQTMGIHTMHWAALLADLHAATGEVSFKQRAIQACSLVTYWMRDDGANLVGPTWGDEIWFSCHFGTALYMYDTLTRFPELLVEGRQTLSLDQGWRFHLGDVTEGEKPEMSDADWRTLDVPHDFSIEGPPGADPATMEGPFDQRSPGGSGSGSLNGGIAWYRKTFTLPEDARGKRVFVQFDGVYMDSDVWLNGAHLGKHPYGYTSFQYDLTPQMKPGGNVLAVRVNVQQPCSRWYSGAGIYRHVWLTITDPVHVAQWGTYVTTPEVLDAAAQVRVRTRVQNEGETRVKATLTTGIVDAGGKKIAEHQAAEQIAAGGSHEFDQSLKVANPRRWSIENPYLYRAVSEVRVGDRLVDRYETSFGIRTIEFAAEKGFLLNGKRVQLKGVCNHHDLGCLGAAVHRRGIERQLEILKAMGCNAIRTSHNPPAPELLELCDRMGLVVMDEAFDEWIIPKSGMRYGYGRFFDEWSERDMVSMIHRDRNHPSVILWSIGNEIKEQAAPHGGTMAKRLADICHREDPTRPVTSGVNKMGSAVQNGFTKALDVLGINYFTGEYEKQRGQLLVAAETSSALSTRGEYGLTLKPDGQVAINMRANNQCVSYDLDRPGWGCTAEDSLLAIKNAPWVAGEFVWTGFDYIGEPTPYGWPSRSSYFGIIDLAGFPKDRYYLYQSQWTDKPVIHLLPHWNWKGFEGKEIPVWCFTNAESVELFINGKSLGSKDFRDTKSLHLEWKVPYEPGVLKAVGKKGEQTIVDEVRTAGEPARLIVRPDRKQIAADGEDLSFVEVRIVDKDGNLCPNADNQIAFVLEGPGTIAGVDNGDPTNHEPFKATKHKAFHGLCLAVIQAARTPGEIRLSATAQGLQSEPVAITVSPAAGR